MENNFRGVLIMNISIFEKALFDFFGKLGFYSKNKSFYKSINATTLKFFVQHSTYSDVCYINFWIIIDDLHTNENLFKLKMGDIIGRVIFVVENKETDVITANDYSSVTAFLQNSTILQIVSSLEKDGVSGFLKAFPRIKSTLPLKTVKFLEKHENGDDGFDLTLKQ